MVALTTSPRCRHVRPLPVPAARQMGLFEAPDDRIHRALALLDPDAMAPREALEAIYELKRLSGDD